MDKVIYGKPRFHEFGPQQRPLPEGGAFFVRWLRHRLPTGLYTRSLLIIILPMVLLQAVVAAVFMDDTGSGGDRAPVRRRHARYPPQSSN